MLPESFFVSISDVDAVAASAALAVVQMKPSTRSYLLARFHKLSPNGPMDRGQGAGVKCHCQLGRQKETPAKKESVLIIN